MSLERILAFALLAVSIALLIGLTPGAIRILRTYAGAASRRQEDVTGHAPDPEPEVTERMDALAALAYRRLGETVTRMPGDEAICRVLGADDGRVYALLVASRTKLPGLTGFYSSWSDGTWVGTLHPRGDPLEIAGLTLRVATGTIAEAEGGHRAVVSQLAARLGEPMPVRTIAEVLMRDADYRSRFGGRELRPLVARNLAPMAVAVGLTIVALWLLANVR